ncbi:MAG: hypothetical protein IJI19_04890, partial [Ruminococcus sp.]|nr:hypothetical protein [Ruminococcus sp.]
EVLNSGAKSDDEYLKLFQQVIKDGNYEKVTSKIDVLAYESSGKWRVKIDDKLIKAITGAKE